LLVVNPDRDDDGETMSPDAAGSNLRRRALDRMVEVADEAGMCERTASPKRTR
jgi:hypothetical protein